MLCDVRQLELKLLPLQQENILTDGRPRVRYVIVDSHNGPEHFENLIPALEYVVMRPAGSCRERRSRIAPVDLKLLSLLQDLPPFGTKLRLDKIVAH